MLGSLSDAEDMVQETFLRWEDTNHTTIHKPAAYLTTVVSRQCLDQLKSARVQREQYIGPWLPEPLVDENTDYYSELSHDLSIAFLHTLEQLTPLQRAVFLLHDIFNYTFKEVAHILDRKPAACRKTAQRARQYLQKKQPVSLHAQDENQEKVKRFIDALQARDINQIEQMLARDAILYSDGGGKANAAPKPIHGATKIKQFIESVSANITDDISLHTVHINSNPGLLVARNGIPFYAWTFTLKDGCINRIYIVGNPDKLTHINNF